MRFHPNSLYLATGSSDRTCRLWDVQKGTCVRVFVGHRGSVSTLAISPDGRYLASGSEDLSINLWDLASGRKIKSMTGHASAIHSLSFSAESTVLVSGAADSTVRVWDVLAPPPAVDGPAARKFDVGAVKRLSTVGLSDPDGKSALLPKSAERERERCVQVALCGGEHQLILVISAVRTSLRRSRRRGPRCSTCTSRRATCVSRPASGRMLEARWRGHLIR